MASTRKEETVVPRQGLPVYVVLHVNTDKWTKEGTPVKSKSGGWLPASMARIVAIA